MLGTKDVSAKVIGDLLQSAHDERIGTRGGRRVPLAPPETPLARVGGTCLGPVVTLQVLRLVMALLAGMIPKIIGWLTRHQTAAHDPVAAADR